MCRVYNLAVRILQFTGSFGDGKCGVGDYSFHLARAIARIGKNEVFTITATDSAEVARRHSLSADSECADFADLGDGLFVAGGRGFGFGLRSKLAELGAKSNPDVVLVQYPSKGYGWSLGIPFFDGIIRSLSARIGRKPPVFAVLHEYRDAHPARKAAVRRLARAASVLISPCREEAEAIAGATGKYPRIIPAGDVFSEEIDGESYSRLKAAVESAAGNKAKLAALLESETAEMKQVLPAQAREREALLEVLEWPQRNRFAMFTYGRIVPSKDPYVLLAALDLVKREIPEVKLVIATSTGSGRHQRIFEWHVEKLGLGRQVLFAGSHSAAALKFIAEKCALQVYTFRDGFTTKRSSLISALSFDTPILSQHWTGTPPPPFEYATPGDYRELAAKMIGILGMGEGERRGYENRQRDIQAGFRRQFDFKRIGELFIDEFAASLDG